MEMHSAAKSYISLDLVFIGFHLFSMVCWDRHFSSIITFLENPFRLSVTLKPSLEPLRTIFPWCPLSLLLGSGLCPFNQEKCLRRCGIEDRNGSLLLTQSVFSLWSNCSDCYFWSLLIAGGDDSVVLCVKKKRDGLGELQANRSYLLN